MWPASIEKVADFLLCPVYMHNFEIFYALNKICIHDYLLFVSISHHIVISNAMKSEPDYK